MHRWTWSRGKHSAGAGLVAVLTAFALAGNAGNAVGVQASGPAWRLAHSANATLPGGQLESVSCSSRDACTAVGTSLNTSGIKVTLAERWDGRTWQRQLTPNPAEDTTAAVAPQLLGVSCPARNFCEAVGSYQLGFTEIGLAEGWNGHQWTRQRFPIPTGSASAGLDQVSCTSARFCEAVGSEENGLLNSFTLAATWNGSSWRLQRTPNPAGSTTSALGVVSCSSRAFCEAWGGGPVTNTLPVFAEKWDGTSWRLQAVPANLAMGSVSCVSARFCEALGDGVAEQWNGRSWRKQAIGGQGGLTALSCASEAFCEATGRSAVSGGKPFGLAAVWNGARWRNQTAPSPAGANGMTLNAVSCVAASFCAAGGDFQVAFTGNNSQALAEAWNGRSWRIQRAVAPPGATANTLSSVSCVSAGFCEAVGEHDDRAGNQAGLAEMWNGKSWKIQATPNPTSQFAPTSGTLFGVSCVSAQFCEAVGSGAAGAYAEMWNGKSWQLQTRPGGAVQPESVSCVTVSFCMAVDGFARVGLWNGSSWSAGPNVTGLSPVSSVSCVSASYCEVVGGGQSGNNAAVWNGSSWSLQATAGPSNAFLTAISCTAVNACEATGGFGNQSFQIAPLAESWDGSAWTVQSIPNPATSQGTNLTAVSCSAPGSCAAAGYYQVSNAGLQHALAEVWNGTAWRLRFTPDLAGRPNILNGVSCVASQGCTAVGETQDAGQLEASLVENGH